MRSRKYLLYLNGALYNEYYYDKYKRKLKDLISYYIKRTIMLQS